MIDGLWMGGLILAALTGVALAVLQLPGSWLTLAVAVAFDWHHHWGRIGWKWLVALAVLALAGEIIELAASAVMASKAGASRRASIGALLGGILGMFLCTGFVPIPVVGTISGGVIGCFIGALVGELTLHDDMEKGAKVGAMAALGRIAGLMVKTAVSLVISGAVVVLGWGGW